MDAPEAGARRETGAREGFANHGSLLRNSSENAMSVCVDSVAQTPVKTTLATSPSDHASSRSDATGQPNEDIDQTLNSDISF